MTIRIALVVLGVALGTPTLARQSQQSSPAPVPTAQSVAQQPPEYVFNQVRVFETSLRAAIERAARTFATRVREEIPNFAYSDLIFMKDPIVTGVALPEIGVVFHVQIPFISVVDRQLMTSLARRPVSRVDVPSPNVPVSNVPVATASAVGFEPDREYTNLTREALYDAVLDNALAIPIPDGQMLSVMASDLPPDGLNPLAQRSRVLILIIKGEDLLALRQQKITRDQARERIKESRFGG